jgi:hypothetical protein
MSSPRPHVDLGVHGVQAPPRVDTWSRLQRMRSQPMMQHPVLLPTMPIAGQLAPPPHCPRPPMRQPMTIRLTHFGDIVFNT